MTDLDIDIAARVATVRINRPDKANAMRRQTWEEIARAMDELCADANVRVIVFAGAGGKAFSAGADIGEFAETYKDAKAARAYNDLVRRAQATVHDAPKPVLARIGGLCIGGGCGLAAACDIRFASADARFAITPARIGAAYSFADTKQLVDLVGPARAKDILFSGAQIDAERAFAIGLVDYVVEPEALEATVDDYARNLAALSQNSIAVAKATINAIKAGADTEPADLRRRFNETFASADFREGYAAFVDKRRPEFD